MIFVAAGTKDGRDLVTFLLGHGYDVTASVVSRYGEQLLSESRGSGRLLINDQPLDEKGFSDYFHAHHIRLAIDASHPYAADVSRNLMNACVAQSVPYIRYERDLSEFPGASVMLVHSYEEAARQAACCGKNVFLTTGSRNLERFTRHSALKDCVLTVRVLPTAGVVRQCEELGIDPGHIVAMQGPFSRALNRELYVKYKADVVITKNSGTIGGTDTKVAAAADLALPVIVIDRPVMSYAHLGRTYEDIRRFIEENYDGVYQKANGH